MKYFVFIAFIIISLLAFSKKPTNKFVAKDILFSRDTSVPNKAADSLPYWLFKNRVSEREIDSVIKKAAEETMQLARKKGYVDTTKQR